MKDISIDYSKEMDFSYIHSELAKTGVTLCLLYSIKYFRITKFLEAMNAEQAVGIYLKSIDKMSKAQLFCSMNLVWMSLLETREIIFWK